MSTHTHLKLVLPSADRCFSLTMPSNSEHIAKWNMRSLAKRSLLKHQTDVSPMIAVSHEVNNTKTKGRLNWDERDSASCSGFLFVLSGTWEGINIALNKPTAASPEWCATWYFESEKVENGLAVTRAWWDATGPRLSLLWRFGIRRKRDAYQF